MYSGTVLGAIERSGLSGGQAIGGSEDKGERNNFVSNLAPSFFYFLLNNFFPACLTTLLLA
jgi:hypothetical protein